MVFWPERIVTSLQQLDATLRSACLRVSLTLVYFAMFLYFHMFTICLLSDTESLNLCLVE
jgi:hypothetical protein